MKASEGQLGRVFVIRLEDGDVIPACIENFAKENGVSVGQVIMVGGIGGGQVVVGPRRTDEMPPEPMLLPLDGAHEVVGVGLIAPDTKGKPKLHIHAALRKVRENDHWLPATGGDHLDSGGSNYLRDTGYRCDSYSECTDTF